MKKITKTLLATFIGLIGLSALIIAPTYAYDICTDSNVPNEVKAASGCTGPGIDDVKDISDVVTVILNSIIGMLGLVAVVFIVIGGINYMTSSGDPGKTKKAKDTILYAAIGLVICALAFAITNFTISIINNANNGNTNTNTTTGP